MLPERPVFLFWRVATLNYREPVYRRLNERLKGRLVVCAGRGPTGSGFDARITRKEGYSFTEVPNVWVGGERLHAQPFLRPFRVWGPPSVVVAEESPRSVTLPLLLWYARRQGAGRVLWGHFSSNHRPFDPERHWSDRCRVWLARQAEACVAYTDLIAEHLRPYLPHERIFIARNTLDTTSLTSLYAALDAEGRTAVRARLQFPADAPVMTYIGRLIPSKRLDLLADTFSIVREAHPTASLVVIGDGPEAGRLETLAGDVRLLGGIPEWAESAPFLFAADVVVVPGPLGLAVNHAFALGAPIISQAPPKGTGRYHGPEGAYVDHGENGLLVEPDDPREMAKGVLRVFRHRARFSQQARHAARSRLDIGGMVDGLEAAIRYTEEAVRRR